MKRKTGFRFYTLMTIGFILILVLNCKKNTEDPNAILDIDGNIYHTVTIGTQVWMIENLKTTRYRNGELIGTSSPATLDISGESSPKYQWPYGGNESNVAAYGRLYTGYAITDSRNIAPIGWHIATDTEWKTMTGYDGYIYAPCSKFIETGTTHWQTPNSGATNESGFTALPGGGRDYNGTFGGVGIYGQWWSYSVTNQYNSWKWEFGYDGGLSYINRNEVSKKYGFSVRCVKD
jgi:uncharacterized protein (TIGR02145 family)